MRIDSFKVVLGEVFKDSSKADGSVLAFVFLGTSSKQLWTRVIYKSDTVPAEDVVVHHEDKLPLCPLCNSLSQLL